MWGEAKNYNRDSIGNAGAYHGIEKVIGDYKIRNILGEGAFATVFLAIQLVTGQQVALKLLKPDIAGNTQRRIERFDRETCLYADLYHPNIVRLLDKGRTADGKLFAVFEYVPGETLKDILLREGRLAAAAAGEVMLQVLAALVAAHKAGVVHRDLKPGNIMITTNGRGRHVKVLDFGIGTLVSTINRPGYKRLTVTNELLGTPAYSAPEQLRGEPPTTKSDLYAWGLLLIECLTGHPAMCGVSLAEICHNQLSAADVPLPPAIADHPLGMLLRRVLQKKPELRIGDAEQLHEKFSAIDFNDLAATVEISGSNYNATQNTAVTLTCRDRSAYGITGTERKQITVLACNLGMVVGEVERHDLEVLDRMHMEQLGRCLDIVTRHGGYHAGTLGNNILIYFGYPCTSDCDVIRAARTAADLISTTKQQMLLLDARPGIRFEVRVGIHTGIVVQRRGEVPSGATPNTALDLMRRARAWTALASTASCRLLGQAAGIYSLIESRSQDF